MSHKVSCVILTYNEAKRIRIALSHAFEWADEVVVVDKGSTDETRAIAEQLGAKVAVINFSRQGHEDIAQVISFASNDWVWGFTPGEVPTKKLIETGLSMISDDVDLIMVPMHYYSFGVHSDESPWAGGHQPRLYNRMRIHFTGIAHDPLRAEKIAGIEKTADCYVLHQTHDSAESFIRSHADYMVNEAHNGTPEQVISRAYLAMGEWAGRLGSDPKLAAQSMGWRIYWLGVALHAWNLKNGDISKQYSQRAASLLEVDWKD